MRMFVSATLVTVSLSGSALADDLVTFQLDWLPGGDKAGVFVCMERGYCAEAGITVRLESGRGSSEAITKLATGVSDVGNSGMTALMAARATENVPVTALMSIFNQAPYAFFALEGSGINEVADMQGASIAISPFSATNLFLEQVLAQNGFGMDDVRVTHSDPGALAPMLATQQTQTIASWITSASRYATPAREAGHEVVMMPWSDFGLDLYETSLMASNRFLQERPDVARRFVAAFKRSIEHIRDHPEDTAQALADAIPELDAEVVLLAVQDTMPLIFNDVTQADGLGTFDPERLAETWRQVYMSQGLDADAIDPEDVVDRSFMPDS